METSTNSYGAVPAAGGTDTTPLTYIKGYACMSLEKKEMPTHPPVHKTTHRESGERPEAADAGELRYGKSDLDHCGCPRPSPGGLDHCGCPRSGREQYMR